MEHSRQDHQRNHYKNGRVIADLMEEERKYGLALPENEYPVFKETMVTANKYGEIKIDKQAIHVPNSYHYNKLYLITYWDCYKVVSSRGEVLSEGSRPYMNQAREIPWKSILNNWARKPRSIVYSRYFPYLPNRIAYHINIESMELRKNRTKWLIGLITKYDMQEIDDRFYELAPNEIDDGKTKQDKIEHPYDVNWGIYDSLQPVGTSGSKVATHV